MNPDNRSVDSNDQLSSVMLLGLALAGAAATVGAYLLLGS